MSVTREKIGREGVSASPSGLAFRVLAVDGRQYFGKKGNNTTVVCAVETA
jgi:hypothetical protein